MNARYILSQLRKESQGSCVAAEVAVEVHPPHGKASGAREHTQEHRVPSPCYSERSVVIDIPGKEQPLHVTLYEDPVGVTASGTGATLWDAAIVLTKYLLVEYQPPSQRIVELGAGLGLPSIALALDGNDVTATERGITMDILRRNVEYNCNPLALGRISVETIEWSIDQATLSAQCADKSFDIIIGSDLIFPRNEDAWVALAATFRELLQRPRSGAVPVKGFLAYENREDYVIVRFTEILQSNGICCTKIILSVVDCPPDIMLFELSLTTHPS